MKRFKIILLFIYVILPSLSYGDLVSIGKNLFSTGDEQSELTVNFGEKFFLSSASHLAGEIKIVADSTNEAVFVYKKILKTSSKSKALEYSGLIEIEMYRGSDGVNLVLKAPNPAPWSENDDAGRIEGLLHLPVDCRVEINADYFDFTIEGPLESLENRSSFGRLEIKKINNGLVVHGSNRKIILEDIAGEISVRGNNADIRIDRMKSSVEAAKIRNDGGNIYIQDAEGALDIKSSYGKIQLNNIFLSERKSRIIGVQCPIKMEITEINNADLLISNSYEDVKLFVPNTLSANCELEVELEGEIHVEDLTFVPEIILSNLLRFRSGAGNLNISVNVEGGGSIFLQGVQSTE